MSDLPKGWAITTLGEICTNPQYGWTSKASQMGKLKYLRTSDISSGKIDWETVPFCVEIPEDIAKYKIQKDDILVSRAGSVGISYRVSKVPYDVIFASYLIRFKPLDDIEAGYVESYLKSGGYWKSISDYTAGIAIPNVNATKLAVLEIPIPPLPEQRRIVAKLEKLLHRVDACKERLDKIPAVLKRFRQSILSAACSGRLTADWREKNPDVSVKCHSESFLCHSERSEESETLRFTQGDNKRESKNMRLSLQDSDEMDNLPNGWVSIILKDEAGMRLGKMLDKSKNIGDPTRYLRNINIRWFTFNLSDITFMRTTVDDKRELDIRNGDLLVCEGGEPGRCAVWNLGKTDLIFQKAIHRVRPSNNLMSQWIAFNMKNDADFGHLDDYFTGTTIKHLTGKSLARYNISLPPLSEQHEIVRRVEALFKKADEIEARYKKAKAFVDKLTQSILAKAFRGELAPQEPNDEPASVLIEQIKAEKAKQDQKKQRKGKNESRTSHKTLC